MFLWFSNLATGSLSAEPIRSHFWESLISTLISLNNTSPFLFSYPQLFDRNNDGHICQTELRYLLTQIGDCLTDAEFDEMMADADLNNDGKINYDGEEYHVALDISLL